MKTSTNPNSYADVGIMTFYSARNYGAALQAYALQTVIEAQGCSSQFINWHDNYGVKGTRASSFSKYISFFKLFGCSTKRYFRSKVLYSQTTDEFVKFRLKYLDVDSRPAYDEIDLAEIAKSYKGIIAGSDMVWSDIGQSLDAFFLQFAPFEKRGSYAPSLTGVKQFDEERTATFARYIDSIKYLSFREKEGCTFAAQNCNKRALQVVDPTLLMTKSEWQKSLSLPSRPQTKKYILCYMFGGTPQKLLKKITAIAVDNGLEIRFIPMSPNEFESEIKGGYTGVYGPKDFVDLFLNASFVVTNSYHGLLFSLISQIPFAVIEREKENKWKQNEGRISNILNLIGQGNRLIENETQLNKDQLTINYEHINQLLKPAIQSSYDYLVNQINDLKKNKADRVSKDYGTISELSVKQCFSCGVCKETCPTSAIDLKQNEEGFYYPVIDQAKCVQCGNCVTHCPAITNPHKYHFLAAYCGHGNSIETKNSASGGVFWEIAKAIILRGGKVAGAILIENKCKHVIVDSLEDLKQLQGSKYIKSDIQEVYEKTKSLLDNGEIVLFSGTPCQVASLKTYLGVSYRNLYTIDVLCHGVPSQALWDSYCSFISNGNVITDISFRNKDHESERRSAFQLKYKAVNKTVIKEAHNSGYYNLYVNNASFQMSCYYCKFAGIDRIGDITIGDCDSWKHQSGIDLTKTQSMFLVNTEKGQELFDSVQNQLEYSNLDIEAEAIANVTLSHPTEMPQVRRDVYSMVHDLGWAYFEKRDSISTTIHKKVYKFLGNL